MNRNALLWLLGLSLPSLGALKPVHGEPDCKQAISAVQGMLSTGLRSMESARYFLGKARALWAAVPAGCRTGDFYVAGANLLRQPENYDEPLLAEGVRFASAKEALTAGLAADPKAAKLLAYIAYLSRVEPEQSPPLPADACERLKDRDADLRNYVCGVMAFSAGRFSEAAQKLAEVKDPGNFPDAASLREAALHRTQPRALTPRTALAAREQSNLWSCNPFCPLEPPFPRAKRSSGASEVQKPTPTGR